MQRRPYALAAATAAALILVQAGGALQSYTDPSGDAVAGGTDITGVAVRNDAAGAITLGVTTTAPVPANHVVLVVLDTDKNPATGDVGSDYAAVAVANASVVVLFRWTSSGYAAVESANTRFSAVGNVLELGLQRSDLGNTTGFSFVVASADVNVVFDAAPDSGSFAYDLPACSNGVDDDADGKVDHPSDPGCSASDDGDEKDPPVPLKVTAGKPTAVSAATAGRPLTVVMAVTRSDGKPFSAGKVTCSAKAGAKTLRTRGARSGGLARCTMRIPPGTKGQTLRGAIGVQVGAARAAKPFGFTIR